MLIFTHTPHTYTQITDHQVTCLTLFALRMSYDSRNPLDFSLCLFSTFISHYSTPFSLITFVVFFAKVTEIFMVCYHGPGSWHFLSLLSGILSPPPFLFCSSYCLTNSHPCFLLMPDTKKLLSDILSKTKLEAPVIYSPITLHFDF